MALNFLKGIQLWHTEFQSKQTLTGENYMDNFNSNMF